MTSVSLDQIFFSPIGLTFYQNEMIRKHCLSIFLKHLHTVTYYVMKGYDVMCHVGMCFAKQSSHCSMALYLCIIQYDPTSAKLHVEHST